MSFGRLGALGRGFGSLGAVLGGAGSPASTYTLTAGAGSFVLTGDAMTPLVDYRIPADVGAFTEAGQDAGLKRGYLTSAEAGAFTLTGQDVTLTQSSSVTFALDWTDGTSDVSNTTVVSYGTRAFGAADTNRIILVAIGARMSTVNTISSVTIGGVAATLVSGTVAQIGGTNGANSAIYQAAVPTGTTGNVTVTYGAAAIRSAVSVYRLITGTPAVSSANNANNATTPVGAAVTVPASGCGIAMVFNQSAAVTYTWSNAVQDYSVQPAGPSTLATAKISGTGSLTVDATPNASGQNQVFSVAAWAV